MGTTQQERRFCFQYHRLRNGKEAAIHAGYLVSRAEECANRLLQRDDILEEVKKHDEKRSKQNIRQSIRSALERLAFGVDNDSISLLLRENYDPNKLDLFRVSEIKKTKGDSVEVRFYDRYQALNLLQKLSDSANENELFLALSEAFTTPPE